MGIFICSLGWMVTCMQDHLYQHWVPPADTAVLHTTARTHLPTVQLQMVCTNEQTCTPACTSWGGGGGGDCVTSVHPVTICCNAFQSFWQLWKTSQALSLITLIQSTHTIFSQCDLTCTIHLASYSFFKFPFITIGQVWQKHVINNGQVGGPQPTYTPQSKHAVEVILMSWTDLQFYVLYHTASE